MDAHQSGFEDLWASDDSDDLPEELSRVELSKISLSGSDWTTETILNQVTRKNIDLSPRFQRRDAWQPKRKSQFIESLILNLPVPQIVLAEKQDQRGKYIVLDGKQRLIALAQFAGIGSGRWNKFSLRNLEVLKYLNGYNLEQIEADPELNEELDALLNQTIRTVVIRNWTSESVLHLIFVRLNTNNVQLSPQELRLALYPGKFSDFIDDESAQSEPLKRLLKLSEPDFRMRDAELLLRYYSFSNRLQEYSGNLSAFLNDTTEEYNATFDEMELVHRVSLDQFNAALEASFEIFGERHIARKWLGDSYETRFNRAILDVLLYYFRDETVRKLAINRKTEVENAYKRLFEESDAFRDAVQTTTKSLQATYTRFTEWGTVLAEVLGIDLEIPRR